MSELSTERPGELVRPEEAGPEAQLAVEGWDRFGLAGLFHQVGLPSHRTREAVLADFVRFIFQHEAANEEMRRRFAEYAGVAARVNFGTWASTRSRAPVAEEQRREEVERIAAKAREAQAAEELEQRLACMIALKDALATAIESAHEREEEDYRDALVLIKWAAHNTYAEDMTPTQLHGLVEAVELLLADTVDQDTVGKVSRALRKHDLDYIRPLASVEEEA